MFYLLSKSKLINKLILDASSPCGFRISHFHLESECLINCDQILTQGFVMLWTNSKRAWIAHIQRLLVYNHPVWELKATALLLNSHDLLQISIRSWFLGWINESLITQLKCHFSLTGVMKITSWQDKRHTGDVIMVSSTMRSLRSWLNQQKSTQV